MEKQLAKRDNFAYLTIALVVFLLLAAVLDQFLESELGDRLIVGAMVLTLATGVWSVRKQRTLFRTALGFTAGSVLVSATGFFLDSAGFSVFHVVILLGFFLLTAWAAIKQVLFSGRVDGNAIVGAICVYLLIGMIWAMGYMLIELTTPGSFKGLAAAGGSANLTELVYFSFISLTTMGFGDITPVSPLARYLGFMEGIVGQFYIAILVASLVGIKVSRWQQE